MRYGSERDSVIAFMIEAVAQGLLNRLKVTTPPVPIWSMLTRLPAPWHRIKITRVSVLPRDAMYAGDSELGDVLLLRQDLSPEREREAIAEQLFYFLTLRLNAGRIWVSPLDRPNFWAGYFGRCLLLPAAWISGGSIDQVAAVARHFRVTEALAYQRLMELHLPPA